MERIGADPAGVRIMAPKQFHYNLRVDSLTPAQANIIKQELLSLGGEAAVSRGSVSCKVPSTGAVLSGTALHFQRLIKKLRGQSLGLSGVAAALEAALVNSSIESFVVTGRERSWTLGEKTLVMAVLNVTPDSFSDGGEATGPEDAVRKGEELARHADIVDVGGESTRPGSEPVTVEEELERVVPVVEGLASRGIAVSVDTSKAEVARRALEAGAEIINDVTALEGDAEMAGVCADYDCPVVLMHMRGEPRTMQKDTAYDDLTGTVFRYLHERVEAAVEAGVDRDKIIVDPGLGFGKSAEGNLELLRNFREFASLGRPVLVGPSRKAFIGGLTGGEDPAGAERLHGTLAAAAAAVMKGAHVVRVHDARAARAALSVADAIRGERGEEGLWRRRPSP